MLLSEIQINEVVKALEKQGFALLEDETNVLSGKIRLNLTAYLTLQENQ
ncbi:MAG: hypothetical protein WD426_02375 [Anditalea sp.]